MYQCKELNKNFSTKDAMFKELILNKKSIIAAKKAVMKQADSVSCMPLFENTKGQAIKANAPITEDVTELKVTAVINTTNVLDSHGDVHFPGLWKKSLSENTSIMHLQEHQMKFDKIISNGPDLKAYTKDVTWKSLGYDFEGTTQALVFDSTVKASRNAQMFREYKNAQVNNHSVGMYYVKLDLAVDSEEDWAEEAKGVWDKYIDKIVNRDQAVQEGMFWAVTEAKIIEGSAVPIGSNQFTPTIHNNNIEADLVTSKTEPSIDTQTNFTNILKQIKF